MHNYFHKAERMWTHLRSSKWLMNNQNDSQCDVGPLGIEPTFILPPLLLQRLCQSVTPCPLSPLYSPSSHGTATPFPPPIHLSPPSLLSYPLLYLCITNFNIKLWWMKNGGHSYKSMTFVYVSLACTMQPVVSIINHAIICCLLSCAAAVQTACISPHHVPKPG